MSDRENTWSDDVLGAAIEAIREARHLAPGATVEMQFGSFSLRIVQGEDAVYALTRDQLWEMRDTDPVPLTDGRGHIKQKSSRGV